jgi:diguanylate cyclase (GGDEF)-like protein
MLIIAVSIFLSEMATLATVVSLPPMTEAAATMLRGTLLVALMIPALYFFQLRPMQRHVREKDEAAKAIRQARDELEERVRVRTADLAQASQELSASLQASERAHRETSLVSELIELLQACRTSAESAEMLRVFGLRLFPNAVGAVYVYRASRNLLECVAAWPADQEMALFAPEDCWALRRGRQHFVDEADQSLRCRHGKDRPESSTLCIPMMAQGETTGVLVLRENPSSEDRAAISKDTQRLAASAAEQIALALANLDLREKLRDQAIRDALTGMFNRRYFEETAARELRRVESLGLSASLILVDIDHFKRFNDTHGHDAGDSVLKKVSLLLQSKTRTEDIACRYGGEEFVILLVGAPLEVAMARAEALRETVRDRDMRYGGETLGRLTISCGVATFPEHGLTLPELVEAADRALYRAKHEGRDRMIVYSGAGERRG